MECGKRAHGSRYKKDAGSKDFFQASPHRGDRRRRVGPHGGDLGRCGGQAQLVHVTAVDAALEIKGRHDACIVPRVVIVVESMMAVTLCDFALRAGLVKRIIK